MSTDREAGLTALQNGDAAEAIVLLEKATLADPTDYQAFMYLGAAYGRAERHSDSVAALTQAVQLEPSNAPARYNLGLAMEQAGYLEQAVQVYQQAVQLQPDYAKALEALNRLQPAPASIQPPPMEATQVLPASEPTYGASMAEAYVPQPTQSMPPPSGYTPPPPGYTPPPGQAPAYGQTPPVYAGGYAPGGYPQAVYYEDTFDLKQAALDWVQIIRAPRTFFEGQVGRTGYKAPLAFLYLLLIVSALTQLIAGALNPSQITVHLFAAAATLTLAFPFAALGNLIVGGIIHLIGKMFGNRADVSGSFRLYTYASAPGAIFGLILTLLMPFTGINSLNQSSSAAPDSPKVILVQSRDGDSSPDSSPFGKPSGSRRTGRQSGDNPFGANRAPQSNPFSNPLYASMMRVGIVGGIVMLFQFIWVTYLLVIGASNIHQTSMGAAVGTILLLYLLAALLFGLLAFGMIALIAAAASASSR